MKHAYIKFFSQEEKARGVQELSARTGVVSLDEEIFCIPVDSLAVLNDNKIGYQVASQEEVARATQRVWRFAPAPAEC